MTYSAQLSHYITALDDDDDDDDASDYDDNVMTMLGNSCCLLSPLFSLHCDILTLLSL